MPKLIIIDTDITSASVISGSVHTIKIQSKNKVNVITSMTQPQLGSKFVFDPMKIGMNDLKNATGKMIFDTNIKSKGTEKVDYTIAAFELFVMWLNSHYSSGDYICAHALSYDLKQIKSFTNITIDGFISFESTRILRNMQKNMDKEGKSGKMIDNYINFCVKYGRVTRDLKCSAKLQDFSLFTQSYNFHHGEIKLSQSFEDITKQKHNAFDDVIMLANVLTSYVDQKLYIPVVSPEYNFDINIDKSFENTHGMNLAIPPSYNMNDYGYGGSIPFHYTSEVQNPKILDPIREGRISHKLSKTNAVINKDTNIKKIDGEILTEVSKLSDSNYLNYIRDYRQFISGSTYKTQVEEASKIHAESKVKIEDITNMPPLDIIKRQCHPNATSRIQYLLYYLFLSKYGNDVTQLRKNVYNKIPDDPSKGFKDMDIKSTKATVLKIFQLAELEQLYIGNDYKHTVMTLAGSKGVGFFIQDTSLRQRVKVENLVCQFMLNIETSNHSIAVSYGRKKTEIRLYKYPVKTFEKAIDIYYDIMNTCFRGIKKKGGKSQFLLASQVIKKHLTTTKGGDMSGSVK